MDAVFGRQSRLFEMRDLFQQNLAHAGVFVAEIDVDRLRFHHPRGDERAFEEPVGVFLHVMAVLEGPGLALIGVDGDHPRLGLGAHERHLAPDGEAGAAKPAQARIIERRDHAFHFPAPFEAVPQQGIAALRSVGVEIHVAG